MLALQQAQLQLAAQHFYGPQPLGPQPFIAAALAQQGLHGQQLMLQPPIQYGQQPLLGQQAPHPGHQERNAMFGLFIQLVKVCLQFYFAFKCLGVLEFAIATAATLPPSTDSFGHSSQQTMLTHLMKMNWFFPAARYVGAAMLVGFCGEFGKGVAVAVWRLVNPF